MISCLRSGFWLYNAKSVTLVVMSIGHYVIAWHQVDKRFAFFQCMLALSALVFNSMMPN